MADTARTRAAILTLFADNVVGSISAADARDLIVTCLSAEHLDAADYWVGPTVGNITTDKTGRGEKLHSQTVGSACSFGNILYLNTSNTWMRADVAASGENCFLGVAMDSYSSDDADADILIRGIVYDSAFSTTFSAFIGQPIYLASGAPGSVTTTATTSVKIIGVVIGSEAGASASGKWKFLNTDWSVKGA